MYENLVRQPKVIPAPAGIYMPVRQHIKKPWMSDSYHNRVQKKWTKRFGRRWEETIQKGEVLYDESRNAIICRYDDEAEVKRMLASGAL